MGISCVAYTFFSQIFMMIMFAVNYKTLSTRFDYQNSGYHYKNKEVDD